MSFRGRGGGGGFRGSRGGGRGGGRGGYQRRDEGPPEYVEEVGSVSHPCEDDLVVRCTHKRVPYFNAPIFLENKQQIGKIDEILGPITDYYFSVKLSENMKASSFKKLQKLFIDPGKTLPMEMFTNPSKRGGGGRGGRGGRGGGRGGGFSPRGGRGGFAPRGGRGGFSPRGGGFSRGGRGGGFSRGGGRGRGGY